MKRLFAIFLTISLGVGGAALPASSSVNPTVLQYQGHGPSDGEFSAWTKVLSNGQQMKFYVKYPQVGQKIQFLAQQGTGDYKQVAWMRLGVDDLNNQDAYSNLQNFVYFIRTVDLKPGKNRFKVLVDGKQVGTTKTYSKASLPTFQDAIAQLSVAAEDPLGYDRDLFNHWIDADGDGCDTRREVLIVEATVYPQVGSGCSFSGGSWLSKFDGLTTSDASDFDVDHLVPLAEAWRSGAKNWDPATRERFANDLGFEHSLIAVSASSNRSKSDSDPSDWMPTRSQYKCEYLAAWVSVKIRWSLTVDSDEKSALTRLSASCSSISWVLPSKATVNQGDNPITTQPEQGQLDPDFGTCTAAKAGGYGPYVRGVDPEYEWYQDRDNDGIVCE